MTVLIMALLESCSLLGNGPKREFVKSCLMCLGMTLVGARQH